METNAYIGLGIWAGVALLAIIALFSTFFTVKQQTSAVIERMGKFNRVAGAGLRVKIPFIERVSGRINLRIDQLTVKVETKTEDNVFVTIPVAVQYFVQPDKVFAAFYKLNNVEQQMTAFILDVVRGKLPEIKLDDLFKSKEDVAKAVKDRLTQTMSEFGYTIVQALVTDVDPAANVKSAMNDINAAQRQRVAAQDRGESEKILKVKAAEAEAESMKLHGQGIANQRAEITNGFKRSVEELKKSAPNMDEEVIMHMIMMTQYFDAMRDMSDKSGTRTIFFPHSPGGMSDLWKQMAMGNLSTSDNASSPPAETENGVAKVTLKSKAR